MAGKARRIDGRRGDDQLQIGPARQQALEIAQQEIDVQTALVSFIQNEDFILFQLAVALGFREQDAVGHQLDGRIGTGPVGEAHLVADAAAHGGFQFSGNPRRHRTGGDPARLGVTDQPGGSETERDTNFR